MYFKRFKPKNWRKRSGEACRRNCAVLPFTYGSGRTPISISRYAPSVVCSFKTKPFSRKKCSASAFCSGTVAASRFAPRRLSVHNCRNVLKSPYMSPYPSFLHKNPSFFHKTPEDLFSTPVEQFLSLFSPVFSSCCHHVFLRHFRFQKCLPINSNLQILLLFYQLSTYTRSSATSIILVNVFSRSSAVVASPVTAESDTVRIQIAFAPA